MGELVIDEGIVDADPRITWQSLSQLSGDEQFVSNKFNAIGQNINQQQQLESYKNIQKQEHNEENAEEAKENQDKTEENDENVLQSSDSFVARRLALEDELGVNSSDFE